jgi:hypothetical protein
MNFQAKLASGAALSLIVITAVVLSRVQSLQRLGTPGVRVVEHKVYREDGELVGTNTVALPERVLNFESREMPIAKVVWTGCPRIPPTLNGRIRHPMGFGYKRTWC